MEVMSAIDEEDQASHDLVESESSISTTVVKGEEFFEKLRRFKSTKMRENRVDLPANVK